MIYNRRRFGSVAFAACIWLKSTEAQARGLKLRFGRSILRGSRNKTYTPNVLTQKQLEECLRNEAELGEQFRSEGDSELLIEQQREELQALQQNLELRRATLNRYSDDDVDRYNNDIAHYERLRKGFNERVGDHNQIVERANRYVSNFNLNCAGKQYYEDDMIAAKAVLGTATTSE